MTVQSVGPRIQASSTLWKFSQTVLLQQLPQWLGNKESSCNAGHAGDTGDEGQEDLLEEETTTHSRILVWKIPWTEEPGGLESMMLYRVRHNRARTHALKE